MQYRASYSGAAVGNLNNFSSLLSSYFTTPIIIPQAISSNSHNIRFRMAFTTLAEEGINAVLYSPSNHIVLMNSVKIFGIEHNLLFNSNEWLQFKTNQGGQNISLDTTTSNVTAASSTISGVNNPIVDLTSFFKLTIDAFKIIQ